MGKIYRNLIKKNVRLEKKLGELSNKTNELKSILSNMEEGFIIFDAGGKIDYMNESSKNFLNIDESASFDTLISDKEYKLAVKETRILNESKSISLPVNDYYLKIFIDPISDDGRSGFVVIIIDYSESRKAELMRREFSGNVSHELKSPLTSINGYAELIATGIAKDVDIKKFANIIYKEGNRLLEIIDDILLLSRLDEKAYVDIKEEMDTIIEKYKNISNEKFLTVENRLSSYRVYTSKSLLLDLLSNIYENAIKYNKDYGSIKVSSILIDRSIRIFIEDTGIGIKSSDIKRVFERFYVADKSRDRKIKSTGLGLSIVKHIADYLGIEVSVESEFGLGTKFIIDIPIDDREECLLK